MERYTPLKTKADEAEAEFQKWQEKYFDTNSQYASDMCYFYIYNTVKNIMLSLVAKNPGQFIEDIDDKATDATLNIFKKMKTDGTRINKLSSFCYLYARGALFDRKEQKRNRHEVLVGDLFDSEQYKNNNGGNDIC